MTCLIIDSLYGTINIIVDSSEPKDGDSGENP